MRPCQTNTLYALWGIAVHGLSFAGNANYICCYLQAGDTLKNLKLKDTLLAIRRQGVDALYKGDIANSIIEEVGADSCSDRLC